MIIASLLYFILGCLLIMGATYLYLTFIMWFFYGRKDDEHEQVDK